MSAFNRVEQVNDTDILAALRGGESERVERTLTEKDTDGKYSEAVCAFANDMSGSGKPGFLFVGVDDGGVVHGVSDVERVSQNLAEVRSQGNVLPQPMLHIRRMQVDSKVVVVAIVQPADAPPVRYKGRVYIRVGPRRAIANQQEERVLAERSVLRSRTWDHRPCSGAYVSDLALELFKIVYMPSTISAEVIAENGRSTELQLAALRMFDLARGVPTNGGILVFGKDPQYFFPAAYVQYVRYEGTSQSTRPMAERRFSGDLGTVLRMMDELAKSIEEARPERQMDLREKTVTDYPWVAMHELFVNALIHRNYEGSSSPVQINHYSDRIEVLNPGGLLADIAFNDVEGATAYRNPLLAEAAKVLGFANRFGLGLRKARDLVERNGGRIEVTPTQNHFLVTVSRP